MHKIVFIMGFQTLFSNKFLELMTSCKMIISKLNNRQEHIKHPLSYDLM